MDEKYSVGIIKIEAFKCEKCGHIWISQKFETSKDNLPIIRALNVQSPYWNRPEELRK